MKKQTAILILVSITLYSACHKKVITKSNDISNTTITTSKDSSEIKNVIIDTKIDITNIGGASIKVDSLTITGDVLSIFVNYSGGCKEHSFDLYSNGMYAKSLPPQLTLHLKHTNNNDACRMLIMRELKFNISAIKYTNSLSIKVAGQSVKYEPK